MKNLLILRAAGLLLTLFAFIPLQCVNRDASLFIDAGRQPCIDPDYAGITIPPAIAPMHFQILERGVRYRTLIRGSNGDSLWIRSGKPAVIVPYAAWKKLLQRNRGGSIAIEIQTMQADKRWQRFAPIVNRIAPEEIDGYLVYRRIFGHQTIPDIVIIERTLRSFDEKTVLDNRTLSTDRLSCINCHSFCNNQTDRMIVHMRGKGQGMLLVNGKRAVKVNTRTAFNKNPASYASWHPSGKLLAFAVMKVTQALRSTGDPRVVFDESSDLILYDVEANAVTTTPALADPARMETLPEWSPDGRYLYFCSASRPGKVDERFYANLHYREIRYDLMRIPFDPITRSWGAIETVLSARETGSSNVHPKISPDGRFLLFIATPWSYFAGYNDSSDLCLMDLSAGTWRKLDQVNSAYAESFPSWSSNSRWFVFNSRRRDGICGSPYFAYIDSTGIVAKPFLLPQRDPAFYTTHLKSFNVPVLVKEGVGISWRNLSRVAADTAAEIRARFDSAVWLDGITGASAKREGESYAP